MKFQENLAVNLKMWLRFNFTLFFSYIKHIKVQHNNKMNLILRFLAAPLISLKTKFINNNILKSKFIDVLNSSQFEHQNLAKFAH